MILEYAQLLSTAHRVLDGKQIVVRQNNRNVKKWVLPDEREQTLYAATHINHPSAVWVRESRNNYMWLHQLLVQLCNVYTERYERVHKCSSSGLVDALELPPNNIPQARFTPPALAMPDEYKNQDAVLAYRTYYVKGKTHLASWKVHGKPYWYDALLNNLNT